VSKIIGQIQALLGRRRPGPHMARALAYRNFVHSLPVEETAKQYADVKRRRNKRLVLAVSSGRSGMKWLLSVFLSHPGVAGGHERLGALEAFHRYVHFNHLPIDLSGLVAMTQACVVEDWEKADLSVVSSPYFAHGLTPVFNALEADSLVWGINDPEYTVTSLYNKGCYMRNCVCGDPSLATGPQPHWGDDWKHTFGRIEPRGAFHEEWTGLTRVGKSAWYANTMQKEISEQVDRIGREKIWVFRLSQSSQNYAYYQRLADAFGLTPRMSEAQFVALKKQACRPGENLVREWSQQERAEFERLAADYISLYNSGELDDPAFLSSQKGG